MTTRFAPTVGDLAVEGAIAKVAESYRFVLDVTPVNVEEQRRAFLSDGAHEPRFLYRELEADPDVLAAELSAVDLDSVTDAGLRSLLQSKYREVELQLEMLRARGTADFVALSADLYGTPDAALVGEAESILARVPVPDQLHGAGVRAAEFAALAEEEVAHYRALEPDVGVHVEIRPDVAGVMVSDNVLLVSTATNIRPGRVQALLQHEVGTHLLTHVNGAFQPIEMMAAGLAGYEETQEGIAVLAEFLVGGLSPFRLRQIAVRVYAVSQMLAGAPFGTVHRAIMRKGFSPNSAFTTTMRVFRSGGLTKDAIYLQGFLEVLEHVRTRGELDVLWMGKLALSQVPVIEDLLARGILGTPRLRPRYLDFPETSQRLDQIAATDDLVGLIGGAA